MSEFEVLVVPLSLILGLGVTRVLGGFIRAIRFRERVSVHWLPMAWGFFILVYNIHYFNVLYDVNQQAESWTWTVYGPVLFSTVLLFLSAGLIFPRESSADAPGMLGDFQKHGRLALIPLGLLLATSPPINRWLGGPTWISLTNLLNVVLTVLIVVAFVATRNGLRTVATLAFGGISMFGWLFVWSQPGEG